MAISPNAVRESLQGIESAPAPSKPDAYRLLQSQIFSTSSEHDLPENLNLYIQSLLSDSLSILQGRPILSTFVAEFAKISSTEVKTKAGTQILSTIAPRATSFDEQDSAIKRIVAEALEEQDDFSGAAKVLQALNLDGNTSFSPNDRAAHWIKIVRLYLEENQPENAVVYINRIKNILPDVTDRDTRLLFNLSQARILDSQRSFLEASNRYYEVSEEPTVAEDERIFSLSQAITCAILSPAGPQRAGALARLYKDDRSKETEEYPIMESIFLDRLLSQEEVDAFAQKLAPHQKAITSDGSTVLHKAVLEHNVIAVSRLYRNIYFKGLAKILGVDAEKAETYVAQMIEQGRLVGYINQVEGIIFFEGRGQSNGKEAKRWDISIQKLSENADHVASIIEDQYPELIEAGLVY